MDNEKFERMPVLTPGEILKEEFLIPMEISQSKLAGDLDIPISRVNEIVKGKRAITTDTAIRLAKYFNTSVGLWINLQKRFELETLKRSGEYDAIISTIRKQIV